MYGMADLHYIFSILVNGFCFQHFFPYFQSFLSLFHIPHKYLPSAFSIFTTDGPSTSGLKVQSLELKFIYSERATKIWQNFQILFDITYLVSSNSLEISWYFCGLLSIYELELVWFNFCQKWQSCWVRFEENKMSTLLTVFVFLTKIGPNTMELQ